ncbi:MAG: bleomycin resistance protein [Candidatus Nanopelagicales bacterium]
MSTDQITANLPSRSFPATVEFYQRLGFHVAYAGDSWLILRRGQMQVEFFSYPDLDPRTNSFSACLRVQDPDALHLEWQGAGLPDDPAAIPRLTGFFTPPGAPRMFALVDQDGSLWRCMAASD